MENKHLRDVIIDEIYFASKTNKDILFLSVEYGAPSLDRYREDFPDQFINTAISEQNTISVSAGLAKEGKRVYVYSIASFIYLRCLEQIKIDLCSMVNNVTIIAVGTGYAYSEDGPTHHATEDISVIRALSNIIIFSPSNEDQIKNIFNYSLTSNNPMYIRLDRGGTKYNFSDNYNFDDGYVKYGEKGGICIISSGGMVSNALDVMNKLLELNIDSCVIDVFRIKPISREFINELFKFNHVVVIEEHTLNGGLGSIVSEIVHDERIGLDLQRIGIEDDRLYAYGERDKMHKDRMLDSKSVVESIIKWRKNL
jgi:transketolase